MATENIIIEFSAVGIPSTIDQLEKLGQVTRKDADAFDKAGDKSKEFGEKTKKAAHESASELERIENRIRSLTEKIVAAFAVERIIEFGKESVKAFAAAEKGRTQLLNALNGQKEVQERLIKQAEELRDKTAVDPDAIIKQQAFLAVQGRTEDQIKKTIRAAIELSAVTGEDLASSVFKLSATFEGNVGRLGKLDKGFTELSKTQLENGAAIDLVNFKYKGFAEGTVNTTAGKLALLSIKIEEAKKKLGEFLAPAAGGFAEFLGIILETKDDVERLTDAFKDQQTKSNDLQKNISPLLSRYDELKSKTSLSKKEQAELSTIIKEVSGALPEAITGFDKYGNAMGISTDKARELIEAQKLLAKFINAKAIEEAETQLASFNKEQAVLIDRIEKNKQALAGADPEGAFAAGLRAQFDIGKRTAEVVALGEKIKGAELNLKRLRGESLVEEKDAKPVKGDKGDEALEKKRETFLEELRKKFAASEIAEIQDQNEKKRAEARAAFETDVAFIEKGVREKLISARQAGADILKLEESLGKALLVIDDQERQEQDKRRSQINKEQADKDFKIGVANRELIEEQEISAIEESYQKQKDHSTRAEEEKNKAILKIKLSFLQTERDFYEDDAAKQAEIDKKILETKIQLGEQGLKSDKEIAKQREELAKEIGKTIIDGYFQISAAQATIDQQRIQEELDRNNKATDEQSSALQKKFDRGLIGEAQFNIQKKKLDDKKANDEVVARKKENEIKHQQDINNRAQALANIAIHTAEGIVTTVGQLGFVAGGILIPLILALGAAQAGIVLATPLPKYHSGRLAKTSSNEEHAIVRKDETIFPPDLSREFEPSFNAIYNRKIKPATLNEFVSYKLKGGDLSQNITASIDYERLGRTTAEWMVHKMKGMKQTVDVGNMKDLAELMKQNSDPRYRG